MFTAAPIDIGNLTLEQINTYSLDTLMTSKGYVMLGEQPDGTITKIESRDVIFLEGRFSKKKDIDDIDRFFK